MSNHQKLLVKKIEKVSTKLATATSPEFFKF